MVVYPSKTIQFPMHKHFCPPSEGLWSTPTPLLFIHPKHWLWKNKQNMSGNMVQQEQLLTSLDPQKPPHVKPSTSQACRSTVSHEDFNARSGLVPPIAATTCARTVVLNYPGAILADVFLPPKKVETHRHPFFFEARMFVKFSFICGNLFCWNLKRDLWSSQLQRFSWRTILPGEYMIWVKYSQIVRFTKIRCH